MNTAETNLAGFQLNQDDACKNILLARHEACIAGMDTKLGLLPPVIDVISIVWQMSLSHTSYS